MFAEFIISQDLVSRFSLDSASEFLFGSCINSLKQPLQSAAYVAVSGSPAYHHHRGTVSSYDFAEAFRAAEHVCSDRAWRGGTWPLFEILENKSAKHMEVIDRFLDPIVKEALTRKNANVSIDTHYSQDDNDSTLLDHLVGCTTGSLHVLYAHAYW